MVYFFKNRWKDKENETKHQIPENTLQHDSGYFDSCVRNLHCAASDQLLYAVCGWIFTGIDCKSGREIFGKENKNQA